MGLRTLHSLLNEQNSVTALRAQLKTLNKQIKDAQTQLKAASSKGAEVSDISDQLSSIYKQIADKNRANTETVELNYYIKLVNDLTDKVTSIRHHKETPEAEPNAFLSEAI